MLAWARLVPTSTESSESQGAFGFFDRTKELTSDGWAKVIATLRQLHPAPAETWVFDDLEQPSRDTQPGELELYRQTLATLWEHAAGTSRASTTSLIGELFTGLADQEFHIEPTLVELMVGVLKAEAGESVYCGFDLSAALALRLARSQRVFAEIPSRSLAQVVALLAIAGDLSLDIACSDPILGPRQKDTDRPWLDEQDGHRSLHSFDHAIALPPFGRRYHADELSDDRRKVLDVPAASTEVHHLTVVLARGRRRRVTVVTDGFLFRTSKADQFFKEKLLTDHGLSAIISLPRRVLGIGAGVQSSMIMLDGHRAQPREGRRLLFVDGRAAHGAPDRAVSPRSNVVSHLPELTPVIVNRAETAQSTLVALDELLANEFNLSVDRYVVDPTVRFVRSALRERPTATLDDVAELYRPQAVPGAKGGEGDVILHEISLADIENGVVQKPTKLIALSKGDVARVRRAIVDPGDILLSTKGRVGVVGLVPDSAPVPSASIGPDILEWIGAVPAPASAARAPWLAGQAFVIIRLRRSSPINDPRLLTRYLASPFGQALLQTLAGGTTVPMIQMADLRRLPVVVPSAAELADAKHEQERLINLREQIRGLRLEVQRLEENLWPMSLIPARAARGPHVIPTKPKDGHERS